MLVSSQKQLLSKLKNGEIKDDEELKRARRSMRNYVLRQLNSIPDLLDVMDVLGEDQLQGMKDKGQICMEHITRACDLLGDLITIVDPPGVQRAKFKKTGLEAVKRFSPTMVGPLWYGDDEITAAIMSFRRPAAPEEIAVHTALQDLEDKITLLLNPPVIKSNLTMPELIAEAAEKYPGFRPYIDSMNLAPEEPPLASDPGFRMNAPNDSEE